MCLRFVFLLITRLAVWLWLSRHEEAWKTAEILILRHQLAVLQRRPRGVNGEAGDIRLAIQRRYLGRQFGGQAGTLTEIEDGDGVFATSKQPMPVNAERKMLRGREPR